MTNSVKLIYDYLTDFLLEAGFIQYQCHIFIYYKYAPDGTKIVVLSYVDDCVYWYIFEALGKWFVETMGKRFHVSFLEYTNWFVSIMIYNRKYHSISVNQARYATYIVDKYLDTATINTSTKFHKTTLPSDMLFTKANAYTSNYQVDRLTREFNIHYRACIGSLIYFLFTKVDLSFSVHKLENISSNTSKGHFEGLANLLIYIRYNKTL